MLKLSLVSPEPQNISSPGQNRLKSSFPFYMAFMGKIYLTSSRDRSDDVTSGGFISTRMSFRFIKRAQFPTFSAYCKSTFLPASVDIKLDKMKMGN